MKVQKERGEETGVQEGIPTMEAVRARGMVWDQAEILSMSLSCQ
jgi:hypothetical protein